MPLLDYLNRIYLYVSNRKVIYNSIKARKGQCKMCGKCCYIFGMRCPFLSKKNKCKIYKFRPFFLCRLPPLNISEGEIEKHANLNCGYYWQNGKK